MATLLDTRDLKKHYQMGGSIARALDEYGNDSEGMLAAGVPMPFWLIGGAVGFSVTISLIAGSYPAARAARLDPIRALRHD